MRFNSDFTQISEPKNDSKASVKKAKKVQKVVKKVMKKVMKKMEEGGRIWKKMNKMVNMKMIL